MTLYDLMIAFALGCLAMLIWQNAGFRDRAIQLAKQHCERMDVQLLDDTIALTKLRLKKDRRGNIAVSRSYEFEFTSTGDRRYQGSLSLHGKKLDNVDLEPHRV
ncbi:MAG: hypothetical protein CL693_16350 [Cellvibrionaceae bacterium]|nr:hypothetical protein [Cellvibrionaceae bacterium]|tara:strand:- start:1236 stop:1547 length:312 start_codon:yes stop_codon:yes gene_type:complete